MKEERLFYCGKIIGKEGGGLSDEEEFSDR